MTDVIECAAGANLAAARPLPALAERDPVLIGLIGAAGAGKTTAGEYLAERYGFACAAFADPIRDRVCSDLDDMGVDYAMVTEPHLKEAHIAELQWALAANITARRMMQAFGDAGRQLHPDYWVYLAACRLGLQPGGTPVHDRICITDVRYPNEADWVRRRGGVLLRIVRMARAANDSAAQHSSEQHWALLPADAEVTNVGTSRDDLHLALDVEMMQLGIAPAHFGLA